MESTQIPPECSSRGTVQDGVGGIATCYGLESPEIESRWGATFSAPVQTDPGAHPASYTIGNGSFQGIKQPKCDINHSPHLQHRLKKV